MSVANEFDADFEQHTMLALITAVFVFYVATSLGLYFAKTLTRESFYFLALSILFLLWSFKEQVIDFISPALLRLFGVGGQGYLHLLSLWFVDPRDLTFAGVASRVLAGSYSAILAAIFFVPLLFAVITYLMYLYDALDPYPVGIGGVPQQQQQGRAADDSGILARQERSAPQQPSHRTNAPAVSVSNESPEYFSYTPEEALVGQQPEEEKLLLQDFNMDAFMVLCPLGRGVTSYVVLAKVDPSKARVHETEVQNGTLWGAVRTGGADGGKLMMNMETQPIRQEGSFWAEETKDDFHEDDEETKMTTNFPPPPIRMRNYSSGSVAAGSIPDMLDNVLSEIESSELLRVSSDANNDASAARQLENKRIFIPGGGPSAKIVPQRDEGLWRKLEPELGSQSSSPASLKHAARPQPHLQQQQQQSIENNSIASKMKRNSASMNRLWELMGEPSHEGGDNWWRPLQWLDEGQRKKSGMDEVFAVAPGLVENPLSITDLAKLDRAERQTSRGSTANNLHRNGGGNISSGDLTGRRSFGSDDNKSASNASPKQHTPKFSSNFYPSVISLTESEILNLDGDDGGAARDDDDTPSGGGRARVMTITLDEMPDLVAVKVMRKSEIERMGMKRTVENERKALAMCSSPFVCNMFGAFQDLRWAYLLLEPVPAGDLAGLLEQRQVMFEDEARFYVGCLLLALEHLHQRGIACLDVKPENLLLDQYGYCKLCDLGIARILPSTKSSGMSSEINKQQKQVSGFGNWEFVGTPEYMSPEVICRDPIIPGLTGITGPDIWACGVLMFELLSGETPFAGETNTEVVSRIQSFIRDEQLLRRSTRQSRYRLWANRAVSSNSLTTGEEDEHFGGREEENSEVASLSSPEVEQVFEPVARISPAAADLIRKLLKSNPRRRFGCRTGENGAKLIMEHDWFSKNRFDWDALRKREMKAPFVPNPLSLAPPFRGEDIQVDITRERPLSLSELQRCQNFLKGHPVSEETAEIPKNQLWKGFQLVLQFPWKANPDLLDRKSADFKQKVQHVQRLFKDEMD